jgi:hypothetical protein
MLPFDFVYTEVGQTLKSNKEENSFFPLTILEGNQIWSYEMKKCCKKYKKKGKHCKNCPKQ